MATVNDLMEGIIKGKFSLEKYFFSIITVIDPIPFKMNEGKLIYRDFALSFYSTFKEDRDAFKLDVLSQIKSGSTFPETISIEDEVKNLQTIAKTPLKNNPEILNKTIDAYLLLIKLNSSYKGRFYYGEFKNQGDKPIKHTGFWFYISTKRYEMLQILNRTNRVWDRGDKGVRDCILLGGQIKK